MENTLTPEEQAKEIKPMSPEKKIERIKNEMTFQEKADFLPPAGMLLSAGPFLYKVTEINPINLSFKAKLYDLPVIDENGMKHDIDGKVKPMQKKNDLILSKGPTIVGLDGKALKS
jgi:hypothetical protein